MKEKAIEAHKSLKEKTLKRFADLNYWPRSSSKKVMSLNLEAENLAKELDEEIENFVIRSKFLEFNFR